MNRDKELQIMQFVLSNIQNNSPILLLGKAASLFKENYSGDILPFNLDNLSNSLNNNNLAIFELFKDLSNFLYINYTQKPLLFLSEDTNIDNKILSNIKTVIKFSDEINSKLLGAKIAQEDWKAEDDKSNIQKFMTKESPEWYYYKNKFSMNKYIDLFSSD